MSTTLTPPVLNPSKPRKTRGNIQQLPEPVGLWVWMARNTPNVGSTPQRILPTSVENYMKQCLAKCPPRPGEAVCGKYLLRALTEATAANVVTMRASGTVVPEWVYGYLDKMTDGGNRGDF